jgi:abortive infection bacteriophage resistance protein
MSTYSKPHLTFQEQLELLKTRGLEVTEDEAAMTCLRRIGYYRLSAYWYPFRKITSKLDAITHKAVVTRDDTFVPGSRFQHAVELYAFDKRLRLLVLDAIERIEIAVRVDIAHLLGAKDAFAHTNPAHLHGNFTKKVNSHTNKTKYDSWLEKHDQLVKRSKEDFVRHYQTKYGLPLPIWVSVELWDFGLLSTFYQGMTVADKATIAARYDIPDWQVFESRLRTLNFVRNVVAHHSRLWNKNLVDQPRLPKIGAIPDFTPLHHRPGSVARLYVVLCILIHFMKRLYPNSTWIARLRATINEFPSIPNLGLSDMGFPTDWETHTTWR